MGEDSPGMMMETAEEWTAPARRTVRRGAKSRAARGYAAPGILREQLEEAWQQ